MSYKNLPENATYEWAPYEGHKESTDICLLDPRNEQNLTSENWKYYHLLKTNLSYQRPYPTCYACCNICGKFIIASDSDGKKTGGGLRSHLLSHKICTKRSARSIPDVIDVDEEETKKFKQTYIINSFKNMEGPKFKSEIDKAKQKEWSQCKWVIMELQPFSAVKKSTFRI